MSRPYSSQVYQVSDSWDWADELSALRKAPIEHERRLPTGPGR